MRYDGGHRASSHLMRARFARTVSLRFIRRTIRATVLAPLAALLVGASSAHAQEQTGARDELRIDTKDGQRTAIVRAAPGGPAPTVVVLHGAGGSPERIMRRSGFVEAAARHGFAAVFPRGLNRQWNDGREFRHARIDDVDFLKRLAGELARRGNADPARLYIAGISNGGMMTLRMLCEAADLFAGAGSIIANMPEDVGDGCRLNKPVPVVMLNGTTDPLVPYAGGSVGFRGGRGVVWSAERTAAFLARSNGCGEGASESPLPVPAGSAASEAVKVVRLEWSACSSGRSVSLYRLEGAGHQIFGGDAAFSGLLGASTRQISAAETIMAAFAALQKAPRQDQ